MLYYIYVIYGSKDQYYRKTKILKFKTVSTLLLLSDVGELLQSLKYQKIY